MPRMLALCLCIVVILWLFYREHKLRPMPSGSLWITLLWSAIVGTRPISVWLGAGIRVDRPEDLLDGSPLDRNIFILLILGAVVVLWNRKLSWRAIIASNPWLFLFFVYGGVSGLIWSDFPLVSLKRWFKAVGQLAAVLIIATDARPVAATRAVLARYVYLIVPLSIILMKYFPELGRYYNPWTYEPAFSGVTTNKNELGANGFVCGLFLVWELVAMRRHQGDSSVVDRPPLQETTPRVSSGRRSGGGLASRALPAPRRLLRWTRTTAVMPGGPREMPHDSVSNLDRFCGGVLLLMILWILAQAGSSTAQICLFCGAGIILLMRFRFAQKQAAYLGRYAIVLAVLPALVYFSPGGLATFVGQFGRDVTLTGRTDLWADLLKIPLNPILGAGYKSFWLGPYVAQIWQKYYFHPNQAHNGYLETYLQGGLLGLGVLLLMVVSTGRTLKSYVMRGDQFRIFQFTCLITALIYNWTEALFDGLDLVWIMMLLAALTDGGQSRTTAIPSAAVTTDPIDHGRPGRRSASSARAAS